MLNTSVPFGSVAFTSDALVAKQKGVNAMVPAMDANSNYALAQALKQSGVKLKATLYATGYQPDVINSPAWSTLQGDYFLSPFRPWPLPNAGTQQMQAAMEKYAHFTKSQFPNLGQYEAWAGADLMIKGLKMAGPNPTQAAVIKDLRSIKSYNANGLLPQPINYSTIFGHDPPSSAPGSCRPRRPGSWRSPRSPPAGPTSPGRRRPASASQSADASRRHVAGGSSLGGLRQPPAGDALERLLAVAMFSSRSHETRRHLGQRLARASSWAIHTARTVPWTA